MTVVYVPSQVPRMVSRRFWSASSLTVFNAVFALLVRAQVASTRKLLAADAAGVLHLLGVRVCLDLMAHQV